MSEIAKSRGAAKARLLIADICWEHYSSYELPALAERLGLEAGTEQEAFSSKRRFMMKRLNKLDMAALRQVARELAEDIESEELDGLAATTSPADGAISSALIRLDREVVHGRWTAALDRRSNDPEGAITLARTLLEDVMKWLLSDLQIAYDEKADLPVLYRTLAKSLNLSPDSHSEEVFKQILGGCQSIVTSLGALRNRLSDAHSSGPLRAKPQARHAELAVNLAGTMATFLVATWEARKPTSDRRLGR